jgi:colanic acid biosynthesis glycosyl transferase WcaI
MINLSEDDVEGHDPLPSGSSVHRLLNRLVNLIYRRVDRVICLDESAVLPLVKTEPEKVALIHNLKSEEHPSPDSMGVYILLKGSEKKDHVRLMYSGCLDIITEMETLIWAMQRLENDVSLRMLFIEQARMEELGRQPFTYLGANELYFNPPVLLNWFCMMLDVAMIHTIYQQPGSDGRMIPGKIYRALMVGSPVLYLGSEDSEGGQIVRKSGGGIIVNPQDAQAVYDALQSLAIDSEFRQALALRGRTYYEERFGRAQIIRVIAETIESTAEQHQPV